MLSRVERPERVLAITFTRKATQEMRHRILGRLAQARAGEEPDMPHEREAVALAARVLARDRQLGWNLLENPGRLRISTIDGLCAQLLSHDPVHGPGWSGVSVLENGKPLYREAIRRFFSGLDALADSGQAGARQAHEGLVELLVHLNGDAGRLEELIADMLERRSLWVRHLAATREDLDDLLAQIQARAIAAFKAALGDADLEEALQLTARLGCDASAAGSTPAEELAALHRFAELLTTQAGKLRSPKSVNKGLFPEMPPGEAERLERLREIFGYWAAREDAREALERMAGWPPMVPADEGGIRHGRLLDCARMVLTLATAELQNLMAETGQADYTAITDAALAALGSETEPAELLLAEDARIEHILMDEFQDTSHAQYQLVHRLTAGWAPGDGRTLFLVGDPMQSIYRFREANVGFFNEVVRQRRLGQVALEPLRLRANFRSRMELIDWFNQEFSDIFPDEAQSDSGAVTYTAVEAGQCGGGGVHLHAIDARSDPGDEVSRIIEIIQGALETLEDPSIAILVRGRKQVNPIAAGLARHGIEFEAVETGQLAGRGVILDLMALTRLLEHPLDRVAAIAVLRCPLLGLTVADIHRLLGDSPCLDLQGALRDNIGALDAGAPTMLRLERLALVLEMAQRQAATRSVAERVGWCWRQLGGEAACADEAEIADAQAFLGLIEELSRERSSGLVERLEETLERRYASSRPSRVQIMTIHKAKGLEFDVVIVPGLERKPGSSTQSLIAHQEFSGGADEAGVLMAAMTSAAQAGVSLYRFLSRVDQQREQYENQRVLYVACTRARQELHLLAGFKPLKSGAPHFPAGSFVKMLAASFSPPAQAVLDEPNAAGEGRTDGLNGDEGGSVPAIPLKRLVSVLPALPEMGLPAGPASSPATLTDLPDREATAVGEVLHRWLELIHDHPQPQWDAARIDRSRPALRSSLLRNGAPAERLDQIEDRVVKILQRLLADPEVMRLVGAGSSRESWSELEVCCREGQGIRRYVIDLLVRGPGGVLDIIDYKTKDSGEDDETARLRQAQLGRYRELVETAGWGPVSQARIEVLEKQPG